MRRGKAHQAEQTACAEAQGAVAEPRGPPVGCVVRMYPVMGRELGPG